MPRDPMKRDPTRRWEIYRSGVRKALDMTKQWRFRRRAANGRVLCNGGESYHNWQDAYDAIVEIERGGVLIGELIDGEHFEEIARRRRGPPPPHVDGL